MENAENRKRARSCAYTDITVAIITYVLVICIFFAYWDKNYKNYSGKHTTNDPTPDIDGWIWKFLVFYTVWKVVVIWIDVLLVKATEPNADPTLSLKRAKLWYYFHICYAILNIFSGIIFMVYRAFMLYRVEKFIEDLETALRNHTPANNIPL